MSERKPGDELIWKPYPGAEIERLTPPPKDGVWVFPNLRDHFAAAALTGLLAYPGPIDTTIENIVQRAYGYADDMLDARDHEPSDG